MQELFWAYAGKILDEHDRRAQILSGLANKAIERWDPYSLRKICQGSTEMIWHGQS